MFTHDDADEILLLGDQFLDDWCDDLTDATIEEYRSKRAQWYRYRALFLAAPRMLELLNDALRISTSVAELSETNPDVLADCYMLSTRIKRVQSRLQNRGV